MKYEDRTFKNKKRRVENGWIFVCPVSDPPNLDQYTRVIRIQIVSTTWNSFTREWYVDTTYHIHEIHLFYSKIIKFIVFSAWYFLWMTRGCSFFPGRLVSRLCRHDATLPSFLEKRPQCYVCVSAFWMAVEGRGLKVVCFFGAHALSRTCPRQRIISIFPLY